MPFELTAEEIAADLAADEALRRADRKLLAEVLAWSRANGYGKARVYEGGQFAGYSWKAPYQKLHFVPHGDPTLYHGGSAIQPETVREAVDVLVAFGVLPEKFSSAFRLGRESAYTTEDATVPDGWRATCERDACADEPTHPGGEHLDPRSLRYDGPSITIGALNMGPRKAARALLAAGAPVPDVVDLVEEIHRLNQANAAIRVDKDRAVRAASERALDCVEHGEMIRHAEKQANFFAEQADTNDRARVALVEVLYALKDAVGVLQDKARRNEGIPATAEVVKAIAAFLDKASKSHDTAWRRGEAKSRKKKAATP